MRIPSPPPFRPRPGRLTPLRLCAASLAGSAVFATLGLADWSGAVPDGTARRAAPSRVPVGRPVAIPGDAHLTWRPCAERPALRCGTLRVPVDHRRPHGATLRLALAKLPATGTPERRLGPLVVGPERVGASAVGALLAHPERYRRLATRYDVVALDPRGTGRSTAVACLDDRALDAFWATDLTPDTAAERRRAEAAVAAYAAACRERSGALLRHLTPADDVADLELLRRALGTSRLNYLGTAHSTRPAQDYAHAHPHRVGRFVLDSLEDPRHPLPPAVPPPRAVADGLERIFAQCVERDPLRCPLGRSTRQAARTWHRLLEGLDRRPVPAPDGRLLTESLARLAAAQAVRGPEATQAAFVDGVVEARAGAGGTLLALADAAVGRGADGHYAPEVTVRAAVGCLRSPRAPSSVEPRPRSLRAGSPTALLTRYLDARCPGRPATTAAPPSPWQGVPARDASGDAASAPVLVLHNVADPVTELAVARRAAARLPDARVVVHHGSGHRVRAVAGPCLRALVDRFLLDGRLPEGTGTGCRGASVAS